MNRILSRHVPLWSLIAMGLLTAVFAASTVWVLTHPPKPSFGTLGSGRQIVWTAEPVPDTQLSAQGADVAASQASAAQNAALLAVPPAILERGWYAVRIGAVNKYGPTTATQCFPLGTEGRPQFVGSKMSDHYHLPNCEWVGKIPFQNKLYFVDVNTAKAQGYKPCTVCEPPAQ